MQIDMAGNTFKATLWLQCAVRGAARDAEFNQAGIIFPTDPKSGKPTFRPSAGWYMDKMDFANAESIKLVDSMVTTEGNDVYMQMRWDGVFQEI